ncbi:hypothetical protein F442_21219 [Phytophthora nicotianae P10297]|uniref:Uncharacterized protein n=2 Tax=Phytophthora nicotianae TaxID=4792 RepID=W2Y4S2_PHYNI|nr:hypothetical protein F444_21399 [Phytophthora nicotianae P1976]ETP29633.1 hypothetical protein F442_21219 [Phytophthora nicotianae P10297]
MKTRDAFAQMEIELQRMHIRAEIIQRMILTGASVEDILKRLKML